MSAWTVTRNHIQYLVDSALRGQGYYEGLRYQNSRGLMEYATDRDSGTELGQMLWDENYKSVRYRYSKSSESSPSETYIHQDGDREVDPVVTLKLIDCLEYQSNEHDGWKTSGAKNALDKLRRKAYSSLPGYEDAPWGIH